MAVEPLVPVAEISGVGDLTSFTLVMPSVSAGNVGQLSIDLLLCRLKARSVCSPSAQDLFAPVVGVCPFSEDSRIFSPFEIFSVPEKHLLIVQQRSDVLRHKKKEFLERLVAWLQVAKFKLVVVLSGCLAVARWDAELAKNGIHYLPCDAITVGPQVKLIGFDRIEKKVDPVCEDQLNYILPAGGVTKALHARCEASSIPLLTLIRYCMEGDNTDDAKMLASACLQALSLELPKQAADLQPPHWKFLAGGTV